MLVLFKHRMRDRIGISSYEYLKILLMRLISKHDPIRYVQMRLYFDLYSKLPLSAQCHRTRFNAVSCSSKLPYTAQCHRTRFQAFSSVQCGSFTVKTVRSLLLSAVIVPPCAVTISLAMARPSPAPPLSVERAESSL